MRHSHIYLRMGFPVWTSSTFAVRKLHLPNIALGEESSFFRSAIRSLIRLINESAAKAADGLHKRPSTESGQKSDNTKAQKTSGGNEGKVYTGPHGPHCRLHRTLYRYLLRTALKR